MLGVGVLESAQFCQISFYTVSEDAFVIVCWCANVLLRVEVDGTSQIHRFVFTDSRHCHGDSGTLEVLSEGAPSDVVDGALHLRLAGGEDVVGDLDVDGIGTLLFTFVHNFTF